MEEREEGRKSPCWGVRGVGDGDDDDGDYGYGAEGGLG